MNDSVRVQAPPTLEDFYRQLPELLQRVGVFFQELDRDFPIREGQSRVDRVFVGREGELTFLWVKREVSLDFVSKSILDYDWIQQNRLLWNHLFGKKIGSSLWKIRLMIFALELQPEVKPFLSYLNPIPLDIYQCVSTPQGFKIDHAFQDRKEAEIKQLDSLMKLPRADPFIPIPVNQEEIQDLLSYQPGTDFWSEEEVTEPNFDLASFQEG